MGSTTLETLGPTLTKVLKHAHSTPFTTRSDFARTYTEHIAVAACEGLISTKQVGTKDYGRVWYITVMGLLRLREEENAGT